MKEKQTECTPENRVGSTLRNRRRELNMTQDEIANELGMNLHQYQRYEYGERQFSNCPMRIGLRICAILKLDPYVVVFGKGE